MHVLMTLFHAPGAADAAITGLRLFHLVGLVLGLGAATLLDLLLVRYLRAGEVTADQYRTVTLAAHVVTIGLALLWLSGIGFLAHYWAFAPAKLANPKIAAKVIIVLLLTLNGVFIHLVVLPYIGRSVGGPLFDRMSTARRIAFVSSGAVSATSWYVPMILGSVPQLNFVVPMTTILLVYGALLVGAIVIGQVVARSMFLRTSMVTIPRSEYESLRAAAGRAPA